LRQPIVRLLVERFLGKKARPDVKGMSGQLSDWKP